MTWDDLKPIVPDFGNHDDLWQEAIEESEEPERSLIRNQMRLSKLLAVAREREASPALATWLSLWTRAFQLIDGVRGALQRQSALAVQILNRCWLELEMQMTVITAPVREDGMLLHDDFYKLQVRQRMEAYVAWALYNDLKYWNRVANPKILKDLFDQQPTREMITWLGKARKAFESFMGKIEIQSNAEAERQREAALRVTKERVALIENLLTDERLTYWVEQLRSKKPPRTFFWLIDEDRDSIAKTSRGFGLPHYTGTHSIGSSVVHGSSIEFVLYFQPPFFGPAVGSSGTDIKGLVQQTVGFAFTSNMFLYLLGPDNLGY